MFKCSFIVGRSMGVIWLYKPEVMVSHQKAKSELKLPARYNPAKEVRRVIIKNQLSSKKEAPVGKASYSLPRILYRLEKPRQVSDPPGLNRSRVFPAATGGTTRRGRIGAVRT